jgi:hypothetical protein
VQFILARNLRKQGRCDKREDSKAGKLRKELITKILIHALDVISSFGYVQDFCTLFWYHALEVKKPDCNKLETMQSHEHSERNKQPITDVLSKYLDPNGARVLEISSGIHFKRI